MPKVLTEEFNPAIFKMVARSGFDPFSHMNLKLMHFIYHECLRIVALIYLNIHLPQTSLFKIP